MFPNIKSNYNYLKHNRKRILSSNYSSNFNEKGLLVPKLYDPS